MKTTKPEPRTWRAPTRRAFVGMLGAAIAAIAVHDQLGAGEPAEEPARATWTGTTRWIGHC